MKRVRSFTVVVFLAGAMAAFAGEAEVSSKNAVASALPPPDLYGSHELQFDFFGAYAPSGPGQHAPPYDEVRPLPFALAASQTGCFLEELRRRSALRISQDPVFGDLAEDLRSSTDNGKTIGFR